MATLSPEVLDKLAKDDPATFAQLAVKLVPKDHDINVMHQTYSDSTGLMQTLFDEFGDSPAPDERALETHTGLRAASDRMAPVLDRG